MLPQQSSLLDLYGPVLLHPLGNTGKYGPSCQTNIENQFFQYCPTRKDNTGSLTFRNWECLYYDWSWDIQWNKAWALGKYLWLRLQDFPLCSGYTSPYISPPVIIQIQYWKDTAVPSSYLLISTLAIKPLIRRRRHGYAEMSWPFVLSSGDLSQLIVQGGISSSGLQKVWTVGRVAGRSKPLRLW